jgi:microcompartment protein CcmL/EutN
VKVLRRYLFHERGFNVEAIGRDAAWIAGEAGFKVSPKVKVLLTAIALIGVDEPLSREKLCPVLGFYVADSKVQALAQARGLLRLAGGGHSAAVHCREPRTAVDFSAAVEVYRVVVNAPCSQGAAGMGTNLAPTYTIGTGFFGRSALGENLGPQHLVHWTRVAWPSDAAVNDRRRRPEHAHPSRPPARGAVRRRARQDPAYAASAASRWTRQRPARGDPAHHRRRTPRGAEKLIMAELRSFIFLDQLQPQTLAYLATWMRGRLPRSRVAAQIIEVAPGLDIEGLTDIALKNTEVEAGILVVERQFGYLEFHSRSTAAVKSSAAAVLQALGAAAEDATRPEMLGSRIITRVDHQHAFLINRNKLGSMILGGESLYTLEVRPASYAVLATNEAEKAANIKVIDYRMIGANGRVYLSGKEAEIRNARDAAEAALRDAGGR